VSTQADGLSTLLEPEQIVYLRVKSSKVRRANGSTSNPYELVAVLTRQEADELIDEQAAQPETA
jgi:hypothetical protein